MKAATLVGVMILATIGAWAVEPAAPKPSSAVATEGVQGDQLRTAVINAEKSLGELIPAQKKIFDEEVIPRYRRFIRGYQMGAQGLVADVDTDAIHNYLAFYAPTLLKRTDPKELRVLVYIKAQPSCEACVKALPQMKKDLVSRLENRGLSVQWLSVEEPKLKLDPKVLDERMSEQFQRLNAAAAVLVRSQIAANDDIDSAHADETRYLVHSFFLLRNFPKIESQLEILDTESVDQASDRLLSDALSEIGASANVIAAQVGDRDEVSIHVKGILDYPEFLRVKGLLQTKLKDIGLVEERRLSRGNAIFAVITKKKSSEVKALLRGLDFEMEIQ